MIQHIVSGIIIIFTYEKEMVYVIILSARWRIWDITFLKIMKKYTLVPQFCMNNIYKTFPKSIISRAAIPNNWGVFKSLSNRYVQFWQNYNYFITYEHWDTGCDVERGSKMYLLKCCNQKFRAPSVLYQNILTPPLPD